MTQPVARADIKAPEIAARLVSARLDARALEAYPGPQPVTLGQALRHPGNGDPPLAR